MNDFAFPGLLWCIGGLLWLFAGDIPNSIMYFAVGMMLVSLSTTR